MNEYELIGQWIEKATTPDPVKHCMYCHKVEYTERNNIELTSGICESSMCKLEAAIDNAFMEKDIEGSIVWLF